MMQLLFDDAATVWWCSYCLMMQLLFDDTATVWWCSYCLMMQLLFDNAATVWWCSYCLMMPLMFDAAASVWKAASIWCNYYCLIHLLLFDTYATFLMQRKLIKATTTVWCSGFFLMQSLKLDAAEPAWRNHCWLQPRQFWTLCVNFKDMTDRL